jgi:ABC-type transport system substrate-binding protein
MSSRELIDPRGRLSRRGFLVAGGVSALTLLTACGGSSQQSSTGGGGSNAWGREMPGGAAGLSKQLYYTGNDSTGVSYKCMDFNEAVYSRGPNADNNGMPLARLDSNFQIHPGQATSWEISKDGLSFTFHLRKGTMWSDGKELTANDYVQTFRHTADPKQAWDFTWYWSGVIKNYTEATKGQVPTSQIGVRQGSDPYTLIVDTEAPTPYLPNMMLYSWPLSAAGLDKYGSGVYNTNPSTTISSGPYRITEWSPDRRVVVGPNKGYKGDLVPYIEQQIGNIYKGGSMLQRFQAGEIDSVEVFPTDIKVAQQDPKMKNLHLYLNPQDFRVFYAMFDVTKKPWDNLKVRQAFAHTVDRDSIIKNIMSPLAIPAYGFLAPGFPSSITDPLKPLTNFDPAKGKQLLADAGYPNGQGFPEVTFYWIPNTPTNPAVVQALAAGWQQTLGVKISLQQLDQTSFYARMNAKPTQIPFGWISYGMDYFDASNMLGVYKGGGRHSWNNSQYDNLLTQAGPETNPQKRNDLYAEAQKLQTGDAPAVFVYYQLHGYYYQPYFKGAALAKDKYGYDGLEWSSYGLTGFAYQSTYIANNVDQYRHAI